MITVRCYESLEEAAVFREEINALNFATERPDPFSTFEFFENFLRHEEHFPAGQGLCLWFLMAFLDERLVGYLALKRVPHSVFRMRTFALSFLVHQDTDRPHLVARPEYQSQVSEAFYVYLVGRKGEWSYLEFQQQDDSSWLFPPPKKVDFRGYWVRQWPSLENGTVHVRWSTLREYFSALSHRFRSNVSRQMRSLLAAGQVELLASSDPATTPALFELYRSIEAYSWKSKANAHIGRHPRRIDYFKGLLDAKQPMRVSVQVLVLDGVPIAGIITGAFMKGLYALHIIYDERQSHLAPGVAMFLLGMRQAIEGQYAYFNLLSGSRYYKVRWLAEITETRSAQIYRRGSALFWRRVLGDWKRSVCRAKPNDTRALFNPVRRDLIERQDKPRPPSKIAKLQAIAGERERAAPLMAEVRKGQGEFLSIDELAAVMPFGTQRHGCEPYARSGRANGLLQG